MTLASLDEYKFRALFSHGARVGYSAYNDNMKIPNKVWHVLPLLWKLKYDMLFVMLLLQ